MRSFLHSECMGLPNYHFGQTFYPFKFRLSSMSPMFSTHHFDPTHPRFSQSHASLWKGDARGEGGGRRTTHMEGKEAGWQGGRGEPIFVQNGDCGVVAHSLAALDIPAIWRRHRRGEKRKSSAIFEPHPEHAARTHHTHEQRTSKRQREILMVQQPHAALHSA